MTLALGESGHESQNKKQEDENGEFKASLGHSAETCSKKKAIFLRLNFSSYPSAGSIPHTGS